MAAGLEQLDAFGSLDELPLSLDDPLWDLLYPAYLPDQCTQWRLEDLDVFGSLESVPYSLDNAFWDNYRCDKFGQIVALCRGRATVTANATFVSASDVEGDATVSALGGKLSFGAGDIYSDASVLASANAIFEANSDIYAEAQTVALASAIRYANGSIYAYADLLVNGYAIRYASSDITSEASVLSTPIRLRLSSGDVSAEATVSSDSIRFRTSEADIYGEAAVTALGGVDFFGAADVNATARLTAIANAIFRGRGQADGYASILVSGNRLGDNWVAPVDPTDPGYIGVPETPPDGWSATAPVIGSQFEGGFYAGEYTLGDSTYFLILSDKAYEFKAKPTDGVRDYKLFVSDKDGLSASDWIAFPTLVQTRPNTNSAYYKTRQKNISGTTDWYIASQAEWQVILNNLHPSNATDPLFKAGGAQALGTSNPNGYWTSSIKPIYSYPAGFSWYIWASESPGGMYTPPITGNIYTNLFAFRPIRRVLKK